MVRVDSWLVSQLGGMPLTVYIYLYILGFGKQLDMSYMYHSLHSVTSVCASRVACDVHVVVFLYVGFLWLLVNFIGGC